MLRFFVHECIVQCLVFWSRIFPCYSPQAHYNTCQVGSRLNINQKFVMICVACWAFSLIDLLSGVGRLVCALTASWSVKVDGSGFD